MLWFLFFWWTFAAIVCSLGQQPGLFESIISFVLGIAGAAIATVCLRQCWEWLPRKKIQRAEVLPPKGLGISTKYERTK